MEINVQKIVDELENKNYDYYGIRIDDDVIYAIGDTTAESRIWDNGEPTEDTLDGTSCIGMRYASDIDKAVEMANIYYGNHVYLIASNDMEYGEDEGEYILKDATVITTL